MNDPRESSSPADGEPPQSASYQWSPSQRGIEIRLPRPVAILLLVLFLSAVLTMNWWFAPLTAAEFSSAGLFRTLFACFAAILGFFFVILLRKKLAMRYWVPASATVVESQVVVTGLQRRPLFAYQYVVDGQAYRSRRIAFNRAGQYSVERANYVARYPVGSQLQVYYDPAQPEQVVIDRGIPALWLVPIVVLVFAALAVYFPRLTTLLAQ